MSDLIKHLRNNPHNKIDAVGIENGTLQKWDTLYFPNNLDVRLCAKNACSTFKHVMNAYDLGPLWTPKFNENYSVSLRCEDYLLQKSLGLIDNKYDFYLFRKNSYRVCVKRDPVERALSAVKYCYKREMNNNRPSLDQIVDTMMTMKLHDNAHFLPQYVWLGTNRSVYHKILDMSEVDHFVSSLLQEINIDPAVFNTHRNTTNVNITVDDLPDEVTMRMMYMYKRDYRYGWN